MEVETLIDVPLIYRLFFLYIEPISALVGSYYAAGQPTQYLSYLSPTKITSTPIPPTETLITLYQLSNLYLLFALNEHFVLSSTRSLKTWRRLLLGLLIADFGHLATMWPLAVAVGKGAVAEGIWAVFGNVWAWDAMEWGSVGFVYMGATMRICFLLGVGLSLGKNLKTRKKE